MHPSNQDLNKKRRIKNSRMFKIRKEESMAQREVASQVEEAEVAIMRTEIMITVMMKREKKGKEATLAREVTDHTRSSRVISLIKSSKVRRSSTSTKIKQRKLNPLSNSQMLLLTKTSRKVNSRDGKHLCSELIKQVSGISKLNKYSNFNYI
jgi:hypothetical protein